MLLAQMQAQQQQAQIFANLIEKLDLEMSTIYCRCYAFFMHKILRFTKQSFYL